MFILNEEQDQYSNRLTLILTIVLIGLMVLQILLTSYRLISVLNKSGKMDWFSVKRVIISIATDVLTQDFPSKDAGIAKLGVKILLALVSLWKQKTAEYNVMTAFDLYIKANGLEYNFNALFVKLILSTKVLDKLVVYHEAIYLSDKETISLVVFPNGDILYLKNRSLMTFARVTDTWEKDIKDRYDHFGALSPGFNMEAQLRLIWETFPDGLFLDMEKDRSLKVSSAYDDHFENGKSTVAKLPKVVFEELEPLEDLYVSMASIPFEEFLDTMGKYRAEGRQKNYLFVGPPGTGKTVFGRKLAKEERKGCLVISGEFFKQFDYGTSDALLMVQEIAPAFIICDDFDRAFDGEISGNMLLFFERMKKNPRFKQTILLATINDIGKLNEALLRPGRFEEIVEFALPSPEDRRKLVESFLQEYGVKGSPEDIIALVQALDGLSQAYIKEFCQRLRVQPSIPKLITHIETTKRLVRKEPNAEQAPKAKPIRPMGSI